MGHLENHLRNWPPLGQDPVEGGVPIVNHQYREPPAERSEAVYDRTDFLRNLRAPVISARQLYDWWRLSAWEQLREAIFPPDPEATAALAAGAATRTPADRTAGRQRSWRGA